MSYKAAVAAEQALGHSFLIGEIQIWDSRKSLVLFLSLSQDILLFVCVVT